MYLKIQHCYLLLYIVLSSLLTSNALYLLPWPSPKDYAIEDEVEVMAVKMTSNVALMYYDYYSLKYCEHQDGIKYGGENLGELLHGDRNVVIPITMIILRNMQCRVICMKTINHLNSNTFISRIDNEYFVQLILDQLPVITEFLGDDKIYDLGYSVGFTLEGKYYINNHLDFVLKYHESSIQGQYRIVGFSVKPSSVHSSHYDNSTDCAFPEVHLPQELIPNEMNIILFSYSVSWVASDDSWSSRWDKLLRPRHKKVHWFSLVNALVIVLMLSGVVAAILIKILRRDISHYNRICDELSDSTFEETGWKLVHGDVFRPPAHSFQLTVLLGSGVQLFCTIFVIFLLACLGFLSPDNKGALLTYSIVIFMFMGSIGGYTSGRFYKTMGGFDYKLAAVSTALFYPAIIFIISALINVLFVTKQSTQALPMPTVAILLALWGFISLPLVYIGFYIGYRKVRYEHPVRINVIPRPVPEQPVCHSMVISAMLSGLFPFIVVFLEFYFVLTAIWEHHFYYLSGFLFLVFIIFTITTSQVAIISTYLLLCSEQYHWWWRSSYLLSMGFTVYAFGYILLFHYTRVEAMSIISFSFYWAYSAIILISLWLLSGTIGMYSSYVFVRKIYSAIKID
ncbi:Transmembrane 9 superfamily member 4-like isoform X3 [Oopsacas minuta]|uniref:Transmembrane 9 superfamily member n=1 Tax=Oopsacas minuta TaxID=111878 RepID=A0AAV7KCN9_9METZ|nr:Transmembrane 9 superfamily member 4-like isoform X3 [Oopsacas minuta]